MPATTLRERTRAAVKAEVTATALDLFSTHGYDATTVAQIARAAGISQSSFFRYFPTKEDVVLDAPSDYVDELVAALTARPAREPIWDSLRETLRIRTVRWAANPGYARQIGPLLAESEALRGRQRRTVDEWQRALVPETAKRLGRRDRHASLRANTVVAVVFACLDTAFQQWQQDDADSGLDDLFDAALSTVRG